MNRSPVAGVTSFTNDAPNVLQIPIASLAAAADADGDALTLGGVNLTSTNGIALFTNSTFIPYSNYVSVPDRINYTVNDGRGGSATGMVLIAASPTGRFTSVPSLTGNAVTLHLIGQPAGLISWSVHQLAGLDDNRDKLCPGERRVRFRR